MEGMAGMMEGMFPPGTNPFSQGMFPPWIEAGLKPKKRGKGKENPNLRFTYNEFVYGASTLHGTGNGNRINSRLPRDFSHLKNDGVMLASQAGLLLGDMMS